MTIPVGFNSSGSPLLHFMKLCKCGCGQEVSEGDWETRSNGMKYLHKRKYRFKSGHNSRVQGLVNLPRKEWNSLSKTGKHHRMRTIIPEPERCQRCNNVQQRKLDLSNISGRYLESPNDWQYVCKKCHSQYDGWIKNVRIQSIETRKKIGEYRKGKPSWNRGRKCPQISLGLKGRKFSDEWKQKISLAKKGIVPWNKGKKKSSLLFREGYSDNSS